jgi:RNA polymerase sigma factor (sigma-70 family)
MEERTPTQQGQPEGSVQTKQSDTARLLSQYIERDSNDIIGIFRSYIRKAGLASDNEGVQEAALELLGEVYLEAVKSARTFDPTRPPRAWLLGIAMHIISKKKNEQVKHQSEMPFSAIQHDQQEVELALSSLALASTVISEGMEQQIEASAQVEYLLSLVSPGDRDVLRMSIIEELDGEALARQLGCSYTAAHVRLCRAKKQLKKRYEALEREGGESNE